MPRGSRGERWPKHTWSPGSSVHLTLCCCQVTASMVSLTQAGVFGALALAAPAYWQLLRGEGLRLGCLTDVRFYALFAVMAHSHVLYYFIWYAFAGPACPCANPRACAACTAIRSPPRAPCLASYFTNTRVPNGCRHWPKSWTAVSRAFPVKLLGDHPVTVFSHSLVVGKSAQLMAVAWYFQPTLATLTDASPLTIGAAAACLAMGQLLNLAIYKAIGADGVYYGFKLGREVPWCTDFPFNAGVRHPQYIGAMLAYTGLFLLLGGGAPSAALSLLVLEAGLYAFTSLMEEAGDNDKSK